jgi:hypothetical protein
MVNKKMTKKEKEKFNEKQIRKLFELQDKLLKYSWQTKEWKKLKKQIDNIKIYS